VAVLVRMLSMRAMPELLHEYRENDDGGSFGPVRERDDQMRRTLLPDGGHTKPLLHRRRSNRTRFLPWVRSGS